jgi:hypothetical protein
MTDPIYSFVKGKGWIVGFGDRRILAETHDGVKIWIIDKKPAPGELYRCYDGIDYPYTEMGTHDNPNLEWFRDLLKDRYFCDINVRSRPTYEEEYVYVTIEKAYL